MTFDTERTALQAEYEQATQEISHALTRNPRDFRSSADHREQLNAARGKREHALNRLSAFGSLPARYRHRL